MEKIKKISIWRILVYFIIYSFIGYIVETLFALVNYNILESRKSFLYGPFCGIYGLGAVGLILSLRYFRKNNYTLFFGGILVGSVIEYVISFIGEVLFDARWWDYSDKFLNINGRICLLYSIFWGILSLLLMRIINPQIDKLIDYIKKHVNLKYLKVLTCLGTIFMIVNALISGMAMNLFLMRMAVENDLNIKNKEQTVQTYMKIYGDPEKSKIIHTFWGDKTMIRTYPNVTIQLEDGSIVFVKKLLPNIQSYIYKWRSVGTSFLTTILCNVIIQTYINMGKKHPY